MFGGQQGSWWAGEESGGGGGFAEVSEGARAGPTQVLEAREGKYMGLYPR